MYKKYFSSGYALSESVSFEGQDGSFDKELISKKLEEIQEQINQHLEGDHKIKDIIVINDFVETFGSETATEYKLKDIKLVLECGKEVETTMSILSTDGKLYAVSKMSGSHFGFGAEKEVAEEIKDECEDEVSESKTFKRLPENKRSKQERISKLKEARAKRESNRVSKLKEAIKTRRESLAKADRIASIKEKLKENRRKARCNEAKSERIAKLKEAIRSKRESKINVRFKESKADRIKAIKESIRAKRLGESKINVRFRESKANGVASIKAKLRESKRSSKINVRFV